MGIFTPATARTDWANDDDTLFEGPLTASGVRINSESALQLSTVWACVRLLTNTIATLPTELIISIGKARFVEFDKPSWLTNPDPADPTMTWTEHVAQVVVSMLLDGNFFTFVPGSIFDPSVLIVLDPRQVEIRRDGRSPIYRVRNNKGQIVADVDAMHMLHGVWMRQPGHLRGLSPIEAARQGIGLGLATEEFGARFFGHGSSLSFGVEVPGAMDKKQKDEFRDAMKESYEGLKRSHSIGVLTAGAKFVTGLGVTNEQAQFLASRKYTVEDIAGRIYGVPPGMVGSQEAGASSYNSSEQHGLEFRQYSVLGLVRRIEDPYNRLVEVPDRLVSSQAKATMRLNMDGLARADLKTRYEAIQIATGGPFMKTDEGRALEDLPPTEGGDSIYVQSQMVPLGTKPAIPATTAA